MMPCFNGQQQQLLIGRVVIVELGTPGVGGKLPTLTNRLMPSWDAAEAFNRRYKVE